MIAIDYIIVLLLFICNIFIQLYLQALQQNTAGHWSSLLKWLEIKLNR